MYDFFSEPWPFLSHEFRLLNYGMRRTGEMVIARKIFEWHAMSECYVLPASSEEETVKF